MVAAPGAIVTLSKMSMWLLLTAMSLLALGGLWLAISYHDLEVRGAAVDAAIDHLRKEALDASDVARRAHLRLDNQQLQVEALGRELGWVDDRSFTRVLTGKQSLPLPPPLPSTRPSLPAGKESGDDEPF